MKKNSRFLTRLAIIGVLASLIGLLLFCIFGQGIVGIKVPGYTTNESVIEFIDKGLDSFWGGGYFLSSPPSESTLTAGHFGEYIKGNASEKTFGNGFENYGQGCYNAESEMVFDPMSKIVTATFVATTKDITFLSWCQSKIKKTMPVWTVDIKKAENGFLVKYHKEQWKTKIIFRIGQ